MGVVMSPLRLAHTITGTNGAMILTARLPGVPSFCNLQISRCPLMPHLGVFEMHVGVSLSQAPAKMSGRCPWSLFVAVRASPK